MKKYIFYVLLIVSFSLVSCGGSSSGGGSTPPPQKTPPQAFSLTAPANNQPCTTGSVVTSDASKLNVTFNWATSANATSYVLKIYSGSTEVYNQTTNSTSKNVTLDKGKTYTWSVTARNTDGEKSSSTFSFITEGVAVENYAPYAAIISLSVTTDNKLSVAWTGSDPDHNTNELKYKVKIYENDNLILTSGTTTATNFTTTSTLFAKTTYKVGVITIDSAGATTTSYQYLVTD